MSEQNEKAVVLYQRPQLTPDVWRMITDVAPTMHLARVFGVASKEQAAAIMLKGYELGLSLSGSFEYIHIVEGKPSLAPRGALALILSSPLNGGVKITEAADKCTVWMKRADNGFEHSLTWTMDDAKKSGVDKPGSGWDKYPANMLRWRTVGFVADVVFPDVTGGMKRADEYGADLTPQGDVIEGSWREVEAAQPVAAAAPVGEAPAPQVEQAITLSDLVTRFGAEAVMAANEGQIPGTEAEVAEVAGKLGTANA